MFLLFYYLHTNFTCILLELLVEYSNYSNSGAYQRGDAYQREVFISVWSPKGVALIRGWRLFEAKRLLEKILYIYSETSFDIKKFIVLLHTLSAYNNLIVSSATKFTLLISGNLCVKDEGVVKSMYTLGLIRQHVERIL